MSIDYYTKRANNRDYSKKTYLTDDSFAEHEKVPSSKNMQVQSDYPDSEFKKPYTSDSYGKMEYDADLPPGWEPDLEWKRSKPDSPDFYPENEFNPKKPATGGGSYPKYRKNRDGYPDRGTEENPYNLTIGEVNDTKIKQDDTAKPCVCPGKSTTVIFPFKIAGASGGDGVERLYMTNNNMIKFDVDANHKLGEGVTVSWKDAVTYEETYGSIDGCRPDECVTCDCTGVSIGYTNLQMSVGNSQIMSVLGAVSGCTYKWAVKSGGGSLSLTKGLSTVYTAPASNANCANNPTISLSVNSVECDTVSIAINGYALGVDAYGTLGTCIPEPGAPNYAIVPVQKWDCEGNVTVALHNCNPNVGIPACPAGCVTCAAGYGFPVGSTCPGTYDLRTVAMKAAGCCPSQYI